MFGQVSGQRKLRLAAADDGTYLYPAPAGPILVAVGRERRPAGPVLRQNGRDISAIRVAELSSQSVEADAGLLRFIRRLLPSGTWPRAHHHPRG